MSRDTTIRDLKAKIAELYVRSETSDQSRQVLEGELVAVRADVAALTEAKEWYSTQLRATQNDRTRIQQESAAARAETITANVAAERLRAENARAKRNLAEVEQRVLTEKQTLARHLEDIEADMVAREAALTAQLRQANESSGRLTSAPTSSDEAEELCCLKAELQRNGERIETMQRENAELSRRLALSQQCVVDRDEMVKSLERDRENAELRAESAEQDVVVRTADVQRLESERSELRLQLASASKERHLIDQSLQTLRRDTAVLETSFRRMQRDLAAKTEEVEKLSSLQTQRLEDQLSEVWPDTEAAAGLTTMSLESPKSLTHVSGLSKTTLADKEVQSDDLVETAEGSVKQKLHDGASVCTATAETQTVEPTVALVTETAEKSLKVDSVVLQSEIMSSATETSETIIADIGSKIIEHPQELSTEKQAHLELELAEKLHVIARLNEELCSVKACLSNAQAELEVASKQKHALESEKLTQPEREGGDSLALNTRDDSVRTSSVLNSTGSAADAAGVRAIEKSSLDRYSEASSQTDEVISQTDELRSQLDALEVRLSDLQQELDVTLDQKLQLEMTKATVEAEASTSVDRLREVERLLQQTQDDMVQLERQLTVSDSGSLEVHNGAAVKCLENEKLSLQSQLDEVTRVHQKDVSRLKSKV